ncbi:MAG: hypothetical protein OEW67_02370 [Cyclobacteriaceae bacterium]|nr:hypothetical protein [Cyclobacteriaceae bacterium]
MNYALFSRLNILIYVFLIFNASIAQKNDISENQTLSKQFKLLLEKSETYNDYKVIKQSELSNFEKIMIDSLNTLNSSKQEAFTKIKSQEVIIVDLNSSISEKNNQLSSSEEENSSISIIGIQINKVFYAIISVIIPLLLIGVIGFLLFKLQHNNQRTKEAKKQLKSLENEYEDHRKRTLDNQMKLKRELQTERNKLLEFKK